MHAVLAHCTGASQVNIECRHSDADQDPVVLVGFRVPVAAADQLRRQGGPRMLLQYTKLMELLYSPQTAACSMKLLEVS